ncbi:hypothetical protein FCV58_15740 [Vibrio sp. F13]|nr:hypothetical protein [Vibrio sp. AIC-3]TKF43278.1 hypothetical protein FCV57_06030 [Vibrio sp. F13]TKF63822.1 hypothetical protein FCV58_15740 [Vibrio sp. F13]TKF71283.1 hypothetical protein FCV55_08075 [Vibrio sp. F13]TKF90538.1 hypothetical protein FCV73_13545 [Vibrio sp. F13]
MKESYKTQRFINFPLMNRVISFHKLTFTYLLRAFVVMARVQYSILTELFHYYLLPNCSE